MGLLPDVAVDLSCERQVGVEPEQVPKLSTHGRSDASYGADNSGKYVPEETAVAR